MTIEADVKPMKAKIKLERQIGITTEIDEKLQIACEFTGMTIAQYGRIAIIEKLCREGFMQHPAMARLQNSQPKPPLAEAAE
jgi:hypothetical protein